MKGVGDKDKSDLVIENNGLKAELERMKLEMQVLKQSVVQKSVVEKSVVEKSVVEKSVVEKVAVEKSGTDEKSDFRVRISENNVAEESEVSSSKKSEVLPEKVAREITVEPTGDVEMEYLVESSVNGAEVPEPELESVFAPTQKSADNQTPETPEITSSHIPKPKTTEAKFFEKISQKSAEKPTEKPTENPTENLTERQTEIPTEKSVVKAPKPAPAVPQLKVKSAQSSEKPDRSTPTPPSTLATTQEPRLKPPSFQKPAASSRKEKKYLQEGGDKLLYKKRLEKLKNSLIPEFHQYAELLLHNEEVIDNVEFCIMDYTFEEAGRRSELNGSVSKKPKVSGNDSRQ
jgi:hypothetical protein